MKSNPFASLYAECNKGNSKEKLGNLPQFPRIIDIELTNVCNFRCLMCPTGTRMMKRESGYMTEEIFETLISQIKGKGVGLRFIRWGEPLLHPQFTQFVTRAKTAGVLCHMNTNGSKMTVELMKFLCDIGFDSIKFSFQGVDRKSYLEMRNTDYFDELLKLIQTFYRIRGNRELPYIAVSTTITYESKQMVESFRADLSPFVDHVGIGYTNLEDMDVSKAKLKEEEEERVLFLKSQQIKFGKHPECPEVFDKISINFDGSVSACCSDYDNKMIIGDLRESSIGQIWISPVMRHYRELLADMQHDKIDLCSKCYDVYNPEGPLLGTNS